MGMLPLAISSDPAQLSTAQQVLFEKREFPTQRRERERERHQPTRKKRTYMEIPSLERSFTLKIVAKNRRFFEHVSVRDGFRWGSLGSCS